MAIHGTCNFGIQFEFEQTQFCRYNVFPGLKAKRWGYIDTYQVSWQSLENDQWTIHRHSESVSKGKSARAMSKQTKVGNNSRH